MLENKRIGDSIAEAKTIEHADYVLEVTSTWDSKSISRPEFFTGLHINIKSKCKSYLQR